jgi:hypothetical protein
MIFRQGFAARVFLNFLRRLLRLTRKTRRKVFLIADGRPVHKSRSASRWLEEQVAQIRIFWLRPELIPVSQCSVTAITAGLHHRVNLLLWRERERCPMAQNQQQALLNALKLELEFCEQGGYKTLVGRFPARASENDPIPMFLVDESKREMRKERSVFQDSPSCLNYRLPVREHPCSECWLIDFVPAEKRGEAVPCHHIPLNERRDTVATLGGPGDAPDIQEALLDWLRRTIQQLEGAPAQSRKPAA